MKRLEYKSLEDIENNVSAIRGSNRYPFSYRRASTHSFEPVIIDGEKAYKIYYYYRYYSSEISKNEYDKLSEDKKAHYHADYSDNNVYRKYERALNNIGIVRSDNTFEFTSDNMHQGIRGMLSSFLRCGISSDVKRGGVILFDGKFNSSTRQYNYSLTVPVFKGQRIKIDTLESVLNYEVKIPRVDRKKSKDLLAKYKTSMVFADTLFKNMDMTGFKELSKDSLSKVEYDGGTTWLSNDYSEAIMKRANQVIDEDFIEAITLHMMTNRYVNAFYSMSDSNRIYTTSRSSTPYYYYVNTIDRFKRNLKKVSDIFTYEVFKANSVYPQSEWSVIVEVDGIKKTLY